MSIFLQGLTMGLAYVAPIGLQNMFVINSSLTQSRSRAYLTALIVIFFDVTLALACFFGIGLVMERFDALKLIVLGAGSLIVIYIGISLLRAKVSTETAGKTQSSIIRTIGAACVVTWFNPQALIDGTMMLGAFRATLPANESMLFIIGVAIASCLWFFSLTTIMTIFGKRISDKALKIINIICGAVIILYGLKLLYNFIIAFAGLF